MDGDKRLTAAQVFEEACPYYMSIGMTYDEFWHGPVDNAKAYIKAHELKTRRENSNMWMQGLYIKKALDATVGNLFKKKTDAPNEYPKEPYPITKLEIEEQKAKEVRLKEERMKAQFASFVAQMAQKMPTEAHS